MKVTKYNPTNQPPRKLVTLLKNKYGDNKNFDFFLKDYQKSYGFCVNNKNIIFTPISVYENEHLIAHIALICDKRLPQGQAFFGFLETEQDLSVFDALWQSLIRVAKKRGISELKGPVNGSIWHQYRCISQTDGSMYFKSEPLSEVYYYKLLKQMNPTSEVAYYSATREKFDKVMGVIETELSTLKSSGFAIEELKNVRYEALLTIAQISRSVFRNSWGYTDLTDKEFLQLYSPDKLTIHLSKLYVLYKNRKIIGFCGTSKEDEQTLILKTICILPEYQGLGLGNALAYIIHLDAQKMGFKKVIYALIREGNQIKNFPKDDTFISRRYAGFEYKM